MRLSSRGPGREKPGQRRPGGFALRAQAAVDARPPPARAAIAHEQGGVTGVHHDVRLVGADAAELPPELLAGDPGVFELQERDPLRHIPVAGKEDEQPRTPARRPHLVGQAGDGGLERGSGRGPVGPNLRVKRSRLAVRLDQEPGPHAQELQRARAQDRIVIGVPQILDRCRRGAAVAPQDQRELGDLRVHPDVARVGAGSDSEAGRNGGAHGGSEDGQAPRMCILLLPR
jgi:hypothetical protein